MIKEGKGIHVINKFLLRKFKISKSRYMVIYTKNPVKRNGKTVFSFKVKVDALDPTLEQNKAMLALGEENK